jgi:hypothetical protein
MKCDFYQRRLLTMENPDNPPAEVVAHLARCAVCRDWQRRLLQLEANVPRLPVPPTGARETLLDRLLQKSPSPESRTLPIPARRWNWRLIAAGAAAAVILTASGIFLGNALWQAIDEPEKKPLAKTPKNDQPPPPLVARVVRCDVRLARASTATERVEALADLADQLQGESKALARASGVKELDRLARLYKKVVRQGVIARSRALPAGERVKVLKPIVARLARAEKAALDLARQTPKSATSLRLIAQTAHEGRNQLRGLMEKGT